jgi:succinyl-CoA synthetase alpha subunit
MSIVNLTQHLASADQVEAGVVSVDPGYQERLVQLLNFTSMPTATEVVHRAEEIATLALMQGSHFAMVGGAPYLMSPLVKALRDLGINALYAFSERVSVEDPTTGVKTSKFQHLGFVGSTSGTSIVPK